TISRRFRSRLIKASLATCIFPASVAERELERRKQRLRFLVVFRRRRDADVQAAHRVDLVVIDFGEDDLFLHPEVVVPTAIEGLARDAAKVAHPRQRDGDETIEELPHALATQGHHAADRIARTDLEAG